MSRSHLPRQSTKYELVNSNREEEHFKLIDKRTRDLGLTTNYVNSLVKIEKFYIKLIKTLLVTAFVVFPIFLLSFSVYQSFDTCNGLFGDSVDVLLKYHKHYKKFNFKYENFYDPKNEVDFRKYPWMVRLIDSFGNKSYFKCSGFLITDRDIATAAHCLVFEFRRKIEIEIHLSGTAKNGFSDSIVIPNDQYKILSHPKFDYYKLKHDIALMKLNKPIKFSKTIYPIRLPFESSLIPENLTLTGWIDNKNTLYNPMLKEDIIPIFSIDDCTRKANRKFDDQIVVASFEMKSIPSQFCGGFDDTYVSRGDSGMPIQLMNENEPVAYGIISSGPKVGVKKPQIFTNIYPYLHWIVCNTGDTFCEVPK